MLKGKIFLLTVISVSILVFLSCEKKVGKQKAEEPPTPVTPNDTVTYTKNIKAIIDNNCVSCHNSATINGSTVLETYEQVKLRAEQGRIKERVLVLKNMPPTGPLSENDRTLIQKWLDSGMKK